MGTLLSLLVLAHEGPPEVVKLLAMPGQPSNFVVGTNFGALLSDDDGQTWKWVCEESIDPVLSVEGGQEVWAMTPLGTILVGHLAGVSRSPDKGCTWKLASAPFTTDAGNTLAISDVHSVGTAIFATSARGGSLNHVWRSTDDGVTWSTLTTGVEPDFFSTVRSAPSRPQRIYVGGYQLGARENESLLVSDDIGSTFERIDITARMPRALQMDGGMDVARGRFSVLAVHPTNPDILWTTLLHEGPVTHTLVLETRDRGQTFQQRLDSRDPVHSIALSADGSTVWVATSRKTYRSGGQAVDLQPVSVPSDKSCVERLDGRIYACGSYELDGFVAARESSAGFEPILTWDRVKAVVSCPNASVVTQTCPPLLPELLQNLALSTKGDGGSEGGDGGVSRPPSPNCRCDGGAGALAGLLVVALIRRRASQKL